MKNECCTEAFRPESKIIHRLCVHYRNSVYNNTMSAKTCREQKNSIQSFDISFLSHRKCAHLIIFVIDSISRGSLLSLLSQCLWICGFPHLSLESSGQHLLSYDTLVQASQLRVYEGSIIVNETLAIPSHLPLIKNNQLKSFGCDYSSHYLMLMQSIGNFI